MPRLTEMDTRGEQIGEDRAAQIALEGPAEIEIERVNGSIDGPDLGTKAEQLAFNEELLTIVIQPSNDPLPEDPVMVTVNGIRVFIYRGIPTRVKRKYVERLARAKHQNVRQNVEAVTPAEVNRLHLTQALRYPFSVIEDRNRNGAAWLRQILAED